MTKQDSQIRVKTDEGCTKEKEYKQRSKTGDALDEAVKDVRISNITYMIQIGGYAGDLALITMPSLD